jgi:hypothetical protein
MAQISLEVFAKVSSSFLGYWRRGGIIEVAVILWKNPLRPYY